MANYLIHYKVSTLQGIGVTPERNYFAKKLGNPEEVKRVKEEIIRDVNKQFNVDLDAGQVCIVNIMKMGGL